jgi:hemolysin III
MTRLREPVSGLTHLAGALLALAGTIWLATQTESDTAKMVTVLVYGMSMVLLYSASAALHLFNGSENTIFLLRRLDHAAIYMLIAGSYTPFAYNLLTGEWRWGMLGFIWFLAALGIVFKLFFFWSGHLSTLFYVGMGWLAVIFTPQMLQLDSTALGLVVGGGVTYSIGAVIYALQRPNFHAQFGHHEIWHLFVMGGSAMHFAAVALLLT